MSKTGKTSQSPHTTSDAGWAEAMRREAVLRPLSEQSRLGKPAVRDAASELQISVPQVYVLLRRFKANPLTATLVPRKPGRRAGSRRLSPVLEAHIEKAVRSVYLQPERPTIKKVWREVRHSSHAAGLTPPSMKALRARISKIPLRDRTKAREGASTAGNQFRLVQKGLRTDRALQVVQIDHTKVDIMLVDDSTRACIGRPWLTVVLDVHTRLVVGLYLSLDPPSATSAALAVAQAVLPKDDWLKDRAIALSWTAQGLPEIIHVDNGREFHSRAFERGCQQYGIRIEYRPPATPRFGGHIERLMGTLMGRVHALPGSTSSNVAARGDYDSEGRAVLSYREFERILTLEVLGPYHHEMHSVLGRTPASSWTEEMAARTPRMPADRDQLLYDFLPFEERVIRRDGVRLFGIQYLDGVLAHVVDHGPGKLRVKYDPRDLSAVFVELPSGEHVRIPYADIGRPPIALWEHREAVARLRSQGRRSVDEYAIFAAVTEQRAQLEEAASNSKAARRAMARLANGVRRPETAKRRLPRETAASDDPEAKVPMPAHDEASGVEFW